MNEAAFPVRVTMVKKKLASGEPCKKCAEAEDLLRRRELWETVDEVIWADETDENSPGMRLAKEHTVATAPFFLVEDARGRRVIESVLKLVKEVLVDKKARALVGLGAQAAASSQVQSLDRSAAENLATQWAGLPPEEIIEHVLARLPGRATIAFSGAEDVALIDMASKTGKAFSVFCLDTGRLHPETYRFIDTVRQYYSIEIDVIVPDFVAVESLVRKKGLFSFYEDGHHECCGVRKVEPLKRALSAHDGWITGQRRDQSPTRTDVPEVMWDTAHRASGMLKANPLAALSQGDVWRYIRDNGVPYNELHDRGYVSIGCEPCTRAARPGEHERAARWWWEDATRRECGLHVK